MEVLNKLIEIPRELLPELREMYRVDWPKYISSFYVIDTCIRWWRQDPNLEDLKIFSLNDGWKADGTFIVIRGTSLFLDTLQDSCENLKIALNLIDFSQPFIISSFSEHVKATVFEAVERQRGSNYMWNPTQFYYLSKEDARNIKNLIKAPTSVVILKPLSRENADQIYDIWSCKHEDSVHYVELLIDFNSHVGLFDKKSDELMAWCLSDNSRLEIGTIAFLQVEEKHFRKGYGSMVVAELASKFAESGDDVTATIVPENFKSIQLFEKLGFRKLWDTYWIWTGPRPDEECCSQ